jgi:hypothetical protein
MTTPILTPFDKITALCKKNGFECRPVTPHTIQFDCRGRPGTHFQLIGNPEQIYQKFLAVLQAMGWEPPTPTGISADQIQTGPDWYEVVDTAGHDALRVGDRVQVIQDPMKCKFLCRSDATLHTPYDCEGNYVTLVGKPLPTPDAPETPMQFNINDSVKVRLTDYGRDTLRQIQDARHSLTHMDSEGYTKFRLSELMDIFGSHIYNGSIRQCFYANIVLLDFPQP